MTPGTDPSPLQEFHRNRMVLGFVSIRDVSRVMSLCLFSGFGEVRGAAAHPV